MTETKFASREEWLAARLELLVQEKAASRQLAALAERRRRLPAVEIEKDIEKDYVFEGADGKVDFGRLAEPFRRELVAYGYRMLGSVDDAEEIVQDVYLEAWRTYGRFEGRSSLRTWLYRIATRAFVKGAARGQRRPLPSDLDGPAVNRELRIPAASPEVTWLQPAPDSLLAGTLADPAAVVVARHTMRLAFIAAMQVLPPQQRAVLILRDVLQWRSSEVAPLLDRYVAAFENADVESLVAVLTEDAVFEMPPFSVWFRGSAVIGAFLAARMRELGRASAVRTSANGQPAVALYTASRAEEHQLHALHVLTVMPDGVAHVVAYQDPSALRPFDLPARRSDLSGSTRDT
jgi:RNA polymerase sigma factor (sigma-70 family)